MKDRVLMSVTQVLDDETGIWANDLTDFGIYTELVKRFLFFYREKGRDALFLELRILKERVNELYEEMLNDEKMGNTRKYYKR